MIERIKYWINRGINTRNLIEYAITIYFFNRKVEMKLNRFGQMENVNVFSSGKNIGDLIFICVAAYNILYMVHFVLFEFLKTTQYAILVRKKDISASYLGNSVFASKLIVARSKQSIYREPYIGYYMVLDIYN